MDSRVPDFPGSLDRARLYPTSGTPNSSLLGPSLADAAARHGSLAVAGDLAARAGTPVAAATSVDPLVAHYQSRFGGLPPPPPSLLLQSPPRGCGSLMSSYLTGNSSSGSSASDLSRSLLSGLSPYWTPPHTTPTLSATDSYARYAASGLGSSLYPPYLSMLGETSPGSLLLPPPPPPPQLPPMPLASHGPSPYHRIHELQKEAFLASGLQGLYSGSSALLSPTSPSASVSGPLGSQDPTLTSSRFPAEDTDRASPNATPAGSSQKRDASNATATNNSSASVGSSASAADSSCNSRPSRRSRESLDDRAGESLAQSRGHSHSLSRPEGHSSRPEKGSSSSSSSSSRDKDAGHRRSHVSPESSHRGAVNLEIKKESAEHDKGTKPSAAKKSHAQATTGTKIKGEKHDTELCKGIKNEEDDKSLPNEVSRTKADERTTEEAQRSGSRASPLAKEDADISKTESVKAERVSPAAGETKPLETCDADATKGSGSDAGIVRDDHADKSGCVSDSNDKKISVVSLDNNQTERKSTDSSARPDPIEIRPQRDIKESASPDKAGSEVPSSRSSSSGSDAGTGAKDGRPVGQKGGGGVKQERSPAGPSGSSAAPTKVLTTTSGGLVCAMYPVTGEDGESSKDGDGPYYKMVYSCTQQKSRGPTGRKVHATTYMPEVGTIASTSRDATQSSPTSAKTPVKPVKTESLKTAAGSSSCASSTCDARTSLSPSQLSTTSTNSNSSFNSSTSSKQDPSSVAVMMLSPEGAGPSTSRSHHRSVDKVPGISPESQTTLRRHILSHSSSTATSTAAMKLKEEPGTSRDRGGCKDDQAINLSTSPRAVDYAAKSGDKHPTSTVRKYDRMEERRGGAGPSGSGGGRPMGPGQPGMPLPYRDLVHRSQFRDHATPAMPLNLVNTSMSPSLNSAAGTANSSSDNKHSQDNSATNASRSSSRDSAAPLSRPSAPVNPAADSAGGALAAAPGMLPPWAGLPYGSMGYMLPWDTMMFREQLRSLPEDERRRLLELGYIPPHLLLDAGLADPRFPLGVPASWPQPASHPAPVSLVVKDNNKPKIKSETSGSDKSSVVRGESPSRRDSPNTKPDGAGSPAAAVGRAPTGLADVKGDEGQRPQSRDGQVHSAESPPNNTTSGGKVIKVDVTVEHKTQVDIKPFSVAPQPPASSNNNRAPQTDEPAAGPNIPVGIAIAQQRSDAKGKEQTSASVPTSGGSSSSSSDDDPAARTGAEGGGGGGGRAGDDQGRNRNALYRKHGEVLPTHSQRSRTSTATANRDGVDAQSEKDARAADGARRGYSTPGDSKPSLPVTAPAGFKLMQDPLTGQLFIIPESVMEGVGRMLPSQTGAAARPATVSRPPPQRLEAVVQPQQQAALRHKQTNVEAKPAEAQVAADGSSETKVNLPPAAGIRHTVARVEAAAPAVVAPASSPLRGSASRSPDVASSATTRSRPQPRLLLGDKAVTVQAQPMPYIPGFTVPDTLDQPSNTALAQVPSHLPYLMDSALLQELQQLRQLHANITSASASTKCESKSVQSRGTSPIVIPDDEGSETQAQSRAKVTTSTSTETEPLPSPQQAPQSGSLDGARQNSSAAVQTSPTVEEQLARPSRVLMIEQSVQTCTECSQIHQAAQELLSIGSRRNSGNNALDAADIEVQGICAGHALHEISPKPIVFSSINTDASAKCDAGARSGSSRAASRSPRAGPSSAQQPRDLSYLEPELCQVSDGLELLSVLAEHAQKQTHSEESEADNASDAKSDKSDEAPSFPVPEERKSSVLARVRGLSNEDDDEPLPMNSPSRLEGYEIPDINKNYNAPKSLLHDKQGGFSGKLFGFKKETAGLLAETTFKYPDVLDGMDAMELEMRMRLAELQRRYKEKQRELARLTPKRDRDSKSGTPKKSSPSRQSSSESETSKKKKKTDANPEPKKSANQGSQKANAKTDTTPAKKSVASTPSKGATPVTAAASAGGKKKPVAAADTKDVSDRTPAKSAKPTATSTPKTSQTPNKTSGKSDAKTSKQVKTPVSTTKKISSKAPAKLVPLPDSDSDDIEGVSWMKDEELKKASLNTLTKGNKPTKSSSTALKANWESSSSSSDDSELDTDGSSYESEDADGEQAASSSGVNTTGELELSVAAATSAALKSKKRKKHPDEPDVKEPDENPVKKRKPGRPKKCGEEEQAGITETIVAKTAKTFGLMSMKDAAGHIKTKAELKASKPMWDENWGIRRSERIFLNDPGPLSPGGEAKETQSKLPPSKLPALKDPTPLLKAASTALALKTKASVKDRSKIRPQDMSEKDGKADSSGTDSSLDSSCSSNSESEEDDVPLSSLVERSVTPEPKSCVIAKEDLKDNMRVLIFMEGLFYEGDVKEIEPPDIYGVVIDGERGNRPHILTQEELLNQAIFDVKATSSRYLPEGTRVCAYWSQQYACLYPGTVAAKGADSPEVKPNLINVEFDDGDSAKIPLHHIRMLPANYPVVSQEPQPLLVLGKRKRRTGSEDVLSAETIRERKLSFGETSQSGDKKKTPSKPVKTGKCTEGIKSSEEMDIPEKSRKHSTDKDTGSRSLSPEKQDKLKARSSGGTQTTFPSSSSNIPASSSLPQGPTVQLKTFSSILKKKHKHKDKIKDKTKLKRLGGKHKHKHHHRKKHKAKDGLKKAKKPQDGKSASKKEGDTEQGAAGSSAKKDKSGKPDPAFSIVPSSSGKQSSDSGKATGDRKKSDLTVRIRSNSGDFTHNPFEFHSEDEDESSSVAGTSTSQSTGPGSESAAEADNSTATAAQSGGASDASDEDKRKVKVPEEQPPEKETTSPTNKRSKASASTESVVTPSKRRRARTTSSDSKSKIAAFLPARQLWRWSGKGTKRPGMKGKAKKEFYRSVTRGNEAIRIGDCAVFLSTGRPNLPYVGRIESLWEGWGGNMVVRTRWFYHPEETRGGKKLAEVKGALYQSPHVDENDVQTISHKCYVLSYTEYRARRAHLNEDNSGIYYLAGTYEPTIGMITFEADVKHH